MADNEAVVLVIVFFNGGGDQQPVFWLDVGTVDVDDLHSRHFAEISDIRDETKEFLGGDERF